MSRQENQPRHSGKDEALLPFQLPPELAEFLKDKRYACVTETTDKGTVLVVKAPARDIESVRGRVPIHVRHELLSHPQAPVIRMVVKIYDQSDRPLALEAFTNIANPAQRADFEALAKQDELNMLFYDEGLTHRLTKGVKNAEREHLSVILNEADRLLSAIPADRFDFDKAKGDVMRSTGL